jgi:hypothetical protein
MIVDEGALRARHGLLDRIELLRDVDAGPPSSIMVTMLRRCPVARLSRLMIAGWLACLWLLIGLSFTTQNACRGIHTSPKGMLHTSPRG